MAVAAAIVGAVLMIGGNIKSNLDQAKSEEKNAEGFDAQADYAQSAHARKMYLLQRQQKDFAGKQRSMFAKSGISFSGSALDVMTGTEVEQYYERIASQNEANQEVSAYRFKAQASRDRAKAMSNPATLIFQSGGTALTAYSNASKSGG